MWFSISLQRIGSSISWLTGSNISLTAMWKISGNFFWFRLVFGTAGICSNCTVIQQPHLVDHHITGKVLWSLWICTLSSEYKDNTGIFDINLTYLLLCILWLFLSCFWIFETLRNFQNTWSMPFISGSPINSKVSKTSRPISLRQSAFGYISQCEYHNSFQLTCYIVHSCSAQSLLCNEIHTGSLWLTFHF